MRSALAVVALLSAFSLAAPALADAPKKACTSFSQMIEKLKAQTKVEQTVKLDKRQTAVVLADYIRASGEKLDADQLYVVKVQEEDGERVGVAFLKKGCMLGIAVVNPDHLAELLGKES